jgi:hypothetical protein
MKEELIYTKVVRCKRMIARLVNLKDKFSPLFGRINLLNKEVVLAIANFKCERCKSEKRLTIHHFIPRKAKEYTDFWRYASQRYYFANSICLCVDCHINYHNFIDKYQDNDLGTISEDKIIKWKKKYA